MTGRSVAVSVLCAARICAATVALLAGPGAVAAEVAGGQPSTAVPRTANPRILLPLALHAESEFEAAERFIRARRWEAALPMLQKLADRDGGTLAWDGNAYLPLRRLVSRRIASLPDEARRAYALLYDAEAQQLYEEGLHNRSAASLEQVAERYLNSTYGAKGASALAAILMDEGEFGAALLVLRETDVLPLDGADAAAVAARKLLCLARLDQREEAERLVADLDRRGAARLTVGGTQWQCSAFLQAAFDELAPDPSPRRRNAWNCSGGNAAGNAPPPSLGAGPLLPLAIELPWPGRTEPDWPCVPAVRPVAGGDAAFVSRDGALIALDMQTLRLKWSAAPPGDAVELLRAMVSGNAPDTEPLPGFLGVGNVHHWRMFDNQGLATLCLADGRLLAVRWNPWKHDVLDYLWEATPEDVVIANELSCYDAATGALLWRTGAGIGAREAALADCWFYTAPTVHQGRAYALAARSGRLHAVCLDVRTGKLLWDSEVGAFESRQQAERFCMSFFLADTSPPSVADGVVVYPTGQGIVCAYDARDGRPLWVSPYERSARWLPQLGHRLNVPTSSWTPRRPVISEGRCLTTPLDSRHMIALSLHTGHLLWQAEFPTGVALLGQSEGRAYVQHAGATCLDARTGDVVWETAPAAPAVGVGTLSREAVLLPERGGVRRLSARTGQDEGLLPHAPALEHGGNLLVLDDALLVAEPDRMTLCLPAGQALSLADRCVAADPRDTEALLRRANVLARAGDMRGATAHIDRALALAAQRGDARVSAYAQREAARVLARLAVRSQEPDLLDRALHIAPRDPALEAELAEAVLELALKQPGQRDPADVYLQLCRDRGMLDANGRFGRGSLWTELARTVRERCAADPQLASAWQERWAELAGRAVASGDPDALAELVRWDPMSHGRPGLLLKLARLRAEAGQVDRARRALAEVIATADQAGVAEQAAVMLDSLLAGPDTGDPAAAQGPQVAQHASAPWPAPSPHVAWSAPGALVPPSHAASPSMRGKVLLIEGAALKCLKAADGSLAWQVDLPPELARKPGASGQTGPDCPAYCAAGESLAVVALPAGLLGLDLHKGELLWLREVGNAARMGARQSIPRDELLGRARHGLPVPRPDRLTRQLAMAQTVCAPMLAACRIVAHGEFVILDAVTGKPLLEHRSSVGGGAPGARTAAAGAKLCVARSSPKGGDLAVYDLKSGGLLARWRPHYMRFVEDLRLTADGRALVADYRGILTLDLRLMEPLAEWRIAGGVAGIPWADQEVVTVNTPDRRTLLLDGRTGAVVTDVTGPDSGEVVWAERRDGVLYVLEAARLRARLPYGPEVHWQGSGFVLRAVRLPDGGTLWTRAWPQEEDRIVGSPVPCEGVWLLRSSGPGRLWVAGVEAASGADVFSVELPGRQRPRPMPLVLSGGRMLLGRGNTVIALKPGGAPLGQAVEDAGGNAR